MNSGATTELSKLIAARFAARDLELFARRRAKAQHSGQRASLFRGRGLEFEEARHYQPGDELRAIDWRVTARTGVAHTKIFREERERPVMLLVDLRKSMGFGSTRRFKSVAAADAAALLAWAALHNGDRAGGLVCGERDVVEVRPSRRRSSTLQLLQSIHGQCLALVDPATNSSADPGQPLSSMLSELRRVARPGSGIFLISDFADFDAACSRQLHLLRRHCDVNAICIRDPLETELPTAGPLGFSNGSERSILDTSDRSLRASYRKRSADQASSLQQEMYNHGVALRILSTADNSSDQLANWFHPRASSAGSRA